MNNEKMINCPKCGSKNIEYAELADYHFTKKQLKNGRWSKKEYSYSDGDSYYKCLDCENTSGLKSDWEQKKKIKWNGK